MKTLDLNAYGVNEMTHQEMVETDGGFFFLVLLLAKPAMEASAQIIREGGTTVTNAIGSK